MKIPSKILLLNIFFISCKKQNYDIKNNVNTKVLVLDDSAQKEKSKIDTFSTKHKNREDENENDEYISKSLFEKWKGNYQLKQTEQIDGWGRESIAFSELILLKPDSCIFRNWLADKDGIRYEDDDNYQEYIGGILATNSKDSIEIYTKRVITGGNNSLSPLLTLSKKGNSYYIYSLITSTPNNGLIKMPLKKL